MLEVCMVGEYLGSVCAGSVRGGGGGGAGSVRGGGGGGGGGGAGSVRGGGGGGVCGEGPAVSSRVLTSLLLCLLCLPLQEFKVGIEWPQCLPGMCVRLVREEEEEGEGEEEEEGEGGQREVTCELHVDWMLVEVCWTHQ